MYERKNKSPLERDIEKSITDLLLNKEGGEPVRVGKKIVKTPDSETTITYELSVNPRTGQHEVVEHIETTKKECAICNGFFSQVVSCEDCGVRVCSNDSRQYSWTETHMIDEGVDGWMPPKYRSYTNRKTLCRSCARSHGMKD